MAKAVKGKTRAQRLKDRIYYKSGKASSTHVRGDIRNEQQGEAGDGRTSFIRH